MPRVVVGPFNRVEGDPRGHARFEGGAVRDAWVLPALPRVRAAPGREGGARRARLVPRVCGICSVSQSVAAARALGAAAGVTAPRNGRLAENLLLACENLADHLTHFYMFFMPDFARASYEGRRWWPRTSERFRAIHGTAAGELLPARASFLGLMGHLAGRWPHTLSLQPGGTSRAATAAEKSSCTSCFARSAPSSRGRSSATGSSASPRCVRARARGVGLGTDGAERPRRLPRARRRPRAGCSGLRARSS